MISKSRFRLPLAISFRTGIEILTNRTLQRRSSTAVTGTLGWTDTLRVISSIWFPSSCTRFHTELGILDRFELDDDGNGQYGLKFRDREERIPTLFDYFVRLRNGDQLITRLVQSLRRIG